MQMDPRLIVLKVIVHQKPIVQSLLLPQLKEEWKVVPPKKTHEAEAEVVVVGKKFAIVVVVEMKKHHTVTELMVWYDLLARENSTVVVAPAGTTLLPNHIKLSYTFLLSDTSLVLIPSLVVFLSKKG